MAFLDWRMGRKTRVKSSTSASSRSRARSRSVARMLERCEDRILMANVSLGAAQSFVILGATAVTSTGLTSVVGDLGVSPGTAVTGFPPGIVTGGTIHAGDAVAAQAHSDLATAYGVLAGEASTVNLTGQDLGGLTLAPGVYHFNTSVGLTAGTGILTLDAQGNPDARFDFQIGTTLTTASNSLVRVINGGRDGNVFFQVGSSATLGTNTAFAGNILALTSITLTTGASLGHGRALALNGAVTMDTNSVSVPLNPAPGLVILAPASAPESANPLTLTVNGTSFVPGSLVQFNGTPLATIFVSGVQLQATIPAIDVGEEGTATVTVVTPGPGGGISSPQLFTITDPPVAAQGGFTLTAPFGTATGSQAVATFTDPGGAEPNVNDPNPPTPDGHYAATINWGDGTPSTPGAITFNAITGIFAVSGNHTYMVAGNLPITVTIHHENAAPVTVASAAIVGDASITIAATAVPAQEGLPFTSEFAHFTSANPSATAKNFTATIHFGDGATGAGTITKDADGVYHVVGSHTYAEEGTYPAAYVFVLSDGGSKATTSFFTQNNLVADKAGIGVPPAQHIDPNLVNPWGITASPAGPFWVADNGTGLATLYDGNGNTIPLVVTIPTPTGVGTSAPTGTVFNPTNTNFLLADGKGAVFLFDTENGTIAGWDGGTKASIVVDNSATGAVYKGLAIGANAGAGLLYATNFNSGKVEVYDAKFAPTLAGSFVDPAIPAGFAPFGIQNLAGNIYVTYAKQDAAKHDDVRGLGNGFVDEYSSAGILIKRVVSGAPLDSPWGLAIAPASFGLFGGDLLVGNFGVTANGDPNAGQINAFDPTTGAFAGALNDSHDLPITLDGLWGLSLGNDAKAGSSSTLDFASGPNGETDGLFGNLVPPGNFVTVADAPLTSVPETVASIEGLPFSGVVATFSDADPGAALADYTASIDWGDGTAPTPGTIVGTGGPNGVTFSVSGTHTYAEEGAFAVVATISDAGGSKTIAKGIAAVADAPLTATGATVFAFAGMPASTVPVASFTDSGGPEGLANYSATIDWGDSGPTSLANVSLTDTTFSVLGNHNFAAPGTYTGRATIVDNGGASTSVVFTSAVLVPVFTPTPVAATEGQPLVNVSLASAPLFVQGQYYAATIDWGDGTAITHATLTQGGGPTVSGSHTYAESGTYAAKITVGDDGAPSLLSLVVPITVADAPVPLTGFLNPASDSGVSNHDAITNVVQPNFFGTTEPGAVVTYTILTPGGRLINLGSVTAQTSGFYSLTSGVALPDGSYTVIAHAVDRNGKTTANAVILPGNGEGPLVIDTVGPKVTDVSFDRLGSRITVGLQDDRSGLDQATVIDGANYRLTKPHSFAKAFIVTGLTTAGPGGPTGVEAVTLTMNGAKHKLPHGVYTFLIRSGGIQDVAGNALDGEFYGFYPSGNNRPGGNFEAVITAFHNIVQAPVPTNGFATPVTPPGRPATGLTGSPTAAQGHVTRAKHAVSHTARVAGQLAHHDAALATVGVSKPRTFGH